jgi:hypothetical protein
LRICGRGPIFEGRGKNSQKKTKSPDLLCKCHYLLTAEIIAFGPGNPSSVSTHEARGDDRGGRESTWREVVAPGQWVFLAITFEAAPVGPSGIRLD